MNVGESVDVRVGVSVGMGVFVKTGVFVRVLDGMVVDVHCIEAVGGASESRLPAFPETTRKMPATINSARMNANAKN